MKKRVRNYRTRKSRISGGAKKAKGVLKGFPDPPKPELPPRPERTEEQMTPRGSVSEEPPLQQSMDNSAPASPMGDAGGSGKGKLKTFFEKITPSMGDSQGKIEKQLEGQLASMNEELSIENFRKIIETEYERLKDQDTSKPSEKKGGRGEEDPGSIAFTVGMNSLQDSQEAMRTLLESSNVSDDFYMKWTAIIEESGGELMMAGMEIMGELSNAGVKDDMKAYLTNPSEWLDKRVEAGMENAAADKEKPPTYAIWIKNSEWGKDTGKQDGVRSDGSPMRAFGEDKWEELIDEGSANQGSGPAPKPSARASSVNDDEATEVFANDTDEGSGTDGDDL